MDAIIENHAILEHFGNCCTAMARGGNHAAAGVVELNVDGAGKERCACAKGQLGGNERVFGRAVGRRFANEAAGRRWRILTLGQAVDFVVKQQDVDVDVAAQGVDEMVAADGQAVAVTADLPNGHFRICNLEAGSDCGSAAMNGVEAIGVAVVRQTRRASDAGDYGGHVGRHAEFGHCLMEAVQNCVVAASGTPANTLVALILLRGICLIFHYFRISLTALTTSQTINGWP